MDNSITIVGIEIAIGSLIIGYFIHHFIIKAKMGNIKHKTEDMLMSAEKDAQTIIKEAEMGAKDLAHKAHREIEQKERQCLDEVKNLEKRVLQKEESIDRKFDIIDTKTTNLDNKEKELTEKEISLSTKKSEYEQGVEQNKRKLEEVAGLSRDEAKKELVAAVSDEARLESGKALKRIEEELHKDSEKQAKKIISLAIARFAGDYVTEKTVSVVHLPSEDMKGRIIGREGRNIRAFETLSGIDLIIDDTPEAVILSGHNPVRRAVAKQSLEKLVADGRIHPSRIEEVIKTTEKEINKYILESGEKAVFDLGLHGIHPEVQKLIGQLRYRSSYTQNIFDHSMEVAFICGIMAAEMGINQKDAKRAGLLHDIGKAVDHEIEGPHAQIGLDLLKKHGESQLIFDAVGQHHDPSPPSLLGSLVQSADAISAARPGARAEQLESYINRLGDLEKIANGFEGVERSFALQAGREVRVMVEGNKVNDEGAVMLSREIAQTIEKELAYPGQIRVTVIRETRATDFAK